MKAGRKQGGFTLLELMITVAVLAILMAIATPSFSGYIKRNAVTSQTNEMIGALRFARATAISRNVMVSICPSANVVSTSPTCSASSTFDSGWLIYTSTAANTAYKSTDELLRVSQGTSNVSVRGNPAGSTQVLTFDARGGATAGAVSIFICAKGGSDSVGRSTIQAGGRRVDVQSGGRSGAAVMATAADSKGAQALCTAS